MNRNAIITIILTLLSLGLYLLLLGDQLNDVNSGYIIKFLIISQLLLILYLGIVFFGRKLNLFGKDQRLLAILIGIALFIRIFLLFGAGDHAFLSDDVYRYLWEGKIVAEGYNPYILSPDDMSGSGFVNGPFYSKINHPNLPTIYPPLSQYIFVIAGWIQPETLFGFKLLSLIFDLIAAALIILWVRRECLPDGTILIYLFSPLVLIEFIFSNHLDIFAMPFLILALYFLSRKKAMHVGIFIALTALVKLFALFIVPLIFLYFTGRERIKFITAFIFILLIGYLPFLLTAGLSTFGSLWTYLGSWQFNGSIFALLKLITSEPVARVISAILFISALGYFSIRNRKSDPIKRSFYIFAAYIIFTPSLFSWYLVWIIPFIIREHSWAFLVLTGTVLLSYNVKIGFYDNGAWSEFWWMRMLEYVPFYLLLFYSSLRLRISPKVAQ